MERSATASHEPWNKGKLVGQKSPLKLKEIWAVRVRLQIADRVRELALFNLAIDSKLRACDLVRLRVRDVAHGERVAARAIVMQQKTQRPVQFEITEQTRAAVANWIGYARLKPEDYLFPSRLRESPHLSTRQYQRGDSQAAAANAERAISIASSHSLQGHTDLAMLFRHTNSDARLNTEVLRDLYRRLKSSTISAMQRTYALCALAALYARSLDAEQGRSVLASIDENSRRGVYAPEILRIEGELIAKSTVSGDGDAERCFRNAVGLARAREEKSFELRAATSLARLLYGQGRRAEAHAALAGVYDWFTEGFDTTDLKAAKTLLEILA